MPQPTRYRVAIHRARGAYFACVPGLPGCVAKGHTEVEAVENVRVAIRTYLLIAQLLAGERPIVQVDIAP